MPVLTSPLEYLKAVGSGRLGTGSAIVGADPRWNSVLIPAANTCGHAEKCTLKCLFVQVERNLKRMPHMRSTMRTISFDFPSDVFSALRMSPEEFAREMRLAAAIQWYAQGRISQRKGSSLRVAVD